MEGKENLLGVLTGAGAGSRRKTAAAIMQGRVMVNGVEATSLRQPVDSRRDRITVDGKEIGLRREKLVYLVMNKPPGVLSAASDGRGRKTVLDLIPEKYRQYRLYPAGRLDRDTTGLVLLTNDGELTNRLTHPRYGHEKEYQVLLDRELAPEEMQKLEKGIELEDGMTAPAKITPVKGAAGFTYSLVMHEGRKRQVRRMFLSLGCQLNGLRRVRLGRLTLENLKEGEVRELGEGEVRRVLA